MTPQARLSAAIEVLDLIADSRASADAVLKAWGRAHRFAGSGDRRAIAERVYGCLRGRARFAWRMDADSGRALVLGSLAQEDTLHEIETLFTGVGHAPAPLTGAERTRLRTHAAEPAHVQAGIPEWLVPQFERAFGDAWIAQAHALVSERAPVDLRVNTLKTTREAVEHELDAAGVQYEQTHLSDVGLRLHPETDVQKLAAFREGRIEIQDESSQIAVWLSGAAPGMTVVDYCAGGGGKTLALATLLSPSRHPGLVPGPAVRAEALREEGSRKRSHDPNSELTRRPRDKPGVTESYREGLNALNTVRHPGLVPGPAVRAEALRAEDSRNPGTTSGVTGSHDPDSELTRGPGDKPGVTEPIRGEGRLIACDIDRARLDNIRPRLTRAGVTAELRHIGPDGEGTEDLRDLADVVFVDAPCSGSGTWRRAPEAPWRLTPDDLDRYHALQTRILAHAAQLVRPGGRLVYATCSILPREDEDTLAAFEAAHPNFHPIPISTAVAQAPNLPSLRARHPGLVPGPGAPLAATAHTVRLTPRLSGTDGFFIALYQRTP